MAVTWLEEETSGLTPEQKEDFALAESFHQFSTMAAHMELTRLLDYFVQQAENTVSSSIGSPAETMNTLVIRWNERKTLRSLMQQHIASFLAQRKLFLQSQGESE